jgi:hypothetical protein
MSALESPEKQQRFLAQVVTSLREIWGEDVTEVPTVGISLLPIIQGNSPTHRERILVLGVNIVLKEREVRLFVVPGAGAIAKPSFG